MRNVSWATIVRLVHERARHCCEYCQTCRDTIGQAMHVEHIAPNGGDDPENLCLACPTCNLSKSTATSALDPITRRSCFRCTLSHSTSHADAFFRRRVTCDHSWALS